jgi:hypothetical protein
MNLLILFAVTRSLTLVPLLFYISGFGSMSSMQLKVDICQECGCSDGWIKKM